MRDKVFKFANKAREAAKSQIGLALISGAAGSAGTHLFNKSKRVQDLEQAQQIVTSLKKEQLSLKI